MNACCIAYQEAGDNVDAYLMGCTPVPCHATIQLRVAALAATALGFFCLPCNPTLGSSTAYLGIGLCLTEEAVVCGTCCTTIARRALEPNQNTTSTHLLVRNPTFYGPTYTAR